MPFDEEEQDDNPSEHAKKIGLKNVSSESSIFDSMPKRRLDPNFKEKIQNAQEQKYVYKDRGAALTSKFQKIMNDKTLPQNKSIFQKEAQSELLKDMIQLAMDINDDANEHEGMGSLGWIALLIQTTLNMKDKVNYLEYELSEIKKTLKNSTLDFKNFSD
jgi:hypothetical protein